MFPYGNVAGKKVLRYCLYSGWYNASYCDHIIAICFHLWSECAFLLQPVMSCCSSLSLVFPLVKVTIIRSLKSGTSAEGSDQGVWGSIVSSPSGVRGGAPATIDIFAYLQIKRGLILNKNCTVCQCVQCKKIIEFESMFSQIYNTYNK